MYENPTILLCSLIMETFTKKEEYVKQMNNNKCALNIMVLEQKKGEYENRYFVYTEIKEPKLEKGKKGSSVSRRLFRVSREPITIDYDYIIFFSQLN